MAQQTAVEWLVKMLYSPVCSGFINGNRRIIPHDIIEQAKEMGRRQILEARENGLDNGFINGNWDSNLYYNETYNK